MVSEKEQYYKDLRTLLEYAADLVDAPAKDAVQYAPKIGDSSIMMMPTQLPSELLFELGRMLVRGVMLFDLPVEFANPILQFLGFPVVTPLGKFLNNIINRALGA